MRGTRKEKQNNIPINAKINVGFAGQTTPKRNNINSTHDNDNNIVDIIGSGNKFNNLEIEEYLI